MRIILDDTQRVCVTYMSHAPAEAVEVPEPDGWDAEYQHDWRREGGVMEHDPLPVPEVIFTPTLGERVAAVEAGQETQDTAIDELVQVVADMIGGAV